jgi:hypothetical protein
MTTIIPGLKLSPISYEEK